MGRTLATLVVNYRTPDLTWKAVRAVARACGFLEPRDWSVVVVDNDSGDGSYEDLCGRLRAERDEWAVRVRILQSGHNGGFGYGNNVGIRAALAEPEPPEFLYVLNSDAFPAEDAVQKLLEDAAAHPEAGIFGSYIHGVDGTPHTTAFRFPSVLGDFEAAMSLGLVTRLLRRYVVPIGIPEQSGPVDWLAGASMLMRREMLEEIGLFDETFFLYFEETDLCLRARRAGWATRYVLESRVAHVGSASTGMRSWSRIPGYWLDSRRHYFRKNHGVLAFHAATLLRVAGGAVFEVRRRVQRKSDHMPAGFLRDLTAHWLSGRAASK